MTDDLELTELDTAVSEACAQGWYGIMTRTVVFMSWKEQALPYATDVGSGMAFRTAGGVAFILTAAHVAEAIHKHGGWLGWSAAKFARPFSGGRVLNHPTIDVGLVVPPKELRAELLFIAEPLDMIVPSYAPVAGDCYQVIGYPAGNVRTELKKREQGFKSFTWLCDQRELPLRRKDGRIQFRWVDKGMPLRRVEDNKLMGTVADTPMGMSGGPLWRHQDVVTSDKLWLQSHACKVVGIQSAWDPVTRQLYLMPSDQWHHWLVAAAAELDSIIGQLDDDDQAATDWSDKR
jgi:hypothetical protein